MGPRRIDPPWVVELRNQSALLAGRQGAFGDLEDAGEEGTGVVRAPGEVGTETGPIEALLPPMIFEDVELAMGDVPALGRHTEAVLAEFGLVTGG